LFYIDNIFFGATHITSISTPTPLKGVSSLDTLTGVSPDLPAMDPVLGGFACLKDTMGRFRTQSLFYETRHPDYSAYFTTKKYDYKGHISMYLKYMEIGDPTEYQVAQRLLGSWDHWLALLNGKWFAEMVEEWREELRVKLESQRFQEMKDVAENNKGTAPGISATKWLADHYGYKTKPRRGRPSKEEKRLALKRVTEEERDLMEDAKLIGLVK
jgi:hypothetical protein